MKKLSLLSQDYVICIIPLWIGNNEISQINLGLTVVFVVLIGIVVFYWLYSNQVIPRSWQVMLKSVFKVCIVVIFCFLVIFFFDLLFVDFFNYSFGYISYIYIFFFFLFLKKDDNVSFVIDGLVFFKISKIFFSGPLKKLFLRLDAHRGPKTPNIKKNLVLNNVTNHPNFAKVVQYDSKYYIYVPNLTTSKEKANFLFSSGVFHTSKLVYLYEKPTIIKLTNFNLPFIINELKNDNRLDRQLTIKIHSSNYIFTTLEHALNNQLFVTFNSDNFDLYCPNNYYIDNLKILSNRNID